MNVYQVQCTVYVTAESMDDAFNVIDQAIAPHSPENLADNNDPSIDALYFDPKNTRQTDYDVIRATR